MRNRLPVRSDPLLWRDVPCSSIEEDRGVFAVMERHVVRALERGVLTANGVDARDVGVDVSSRVPVSGTELVLLRVEILFAARAHRRVLQQLVAAVYAVQR